jgi:DNA end-binding protein Ku
MRAIWKGHIQFSLVTIPVRVYNAIDNAQTISFNLLTREGHNPVSYEKKDKVTGRPLKQEDIVRGYQYEPGRYVIIEDEDIAKIRLKSTRVIEIEGFVSETEVHPTLLETPYFIGPDGEVAAKAYALLMHTLKESGRTGVGKVVLRDRETPVLISPHDSGLLLYRLRYPAEVRSIREVPQLPEVKADKAQLKMARTLVDSMSVKFSQIELKDRYYDALKEVIDAKIAGKEVVSAGAEEPEKVVDIMAALKASIEAARKKPMEKARGGAGKAQEKTKARRKAG